MILKANITGFSNNSIICSVLLEDLTEYNVRLPKHIEMLND